MKIAFVIHNEHFTSRVMQLLTDSGIDYYTRWEEVHGKGQGTESHLGKGGTPSVNTVLMIAFQEEAPLEVLIQNITAANATIRRPDDKIRLFQLPLERIV
jgi:hypothetical protein